MPTVHTLVAELRSRYPSLLHAPELQLAADVKSGGRYVEAPAGTRLFEEGKPCHGFPLLLEGEVSVARGSRSGRTLELYRVLPGEVCVVSAASLLGGRPMTAHGTATRATRLVILSPALFDQWTESAGFRQFVFGVFAERLADLMEVVDAVAFQRLDRRLAEYLLGHNGSVRTTHQSVADELGTVREMITRLLNRFELAGLVKLGRERIEVVDVERLKTVASEQSPPY